MVEDRKTKVLRVKNSVYNSIERYAKSKDLAMSEAISELMQEKGTEIKQDSEKQARAGSFGFSDFDLGKEMFGMSLVLEKLKEDLNQIMEKLAAWEEYGGVVLEYDSKIDSGDERAKILLFRPEKKSQRIQSLEEKIRDIKDLIEEERKEQIEKEQTIELEFDDGVKKVLLNSKDFEIEIKEPGFFSTTASRVAKLRDKKTDQVFEVDKAEDPVKFEKILKFLGKS